MTRCSLASCSPQHHRRIFHISITSCPRLNQSERSAQNLWNYLSTRAIPVLVTVQSRTAPLPPPCFSSGNTHSTAQVNETGLFSQSVFRSFFKTLTNQTVTVELKNDIRIRGILKSVDQYLNIKLDDVEVLDLDKYPHLSSVKNMFIRGSVVRYVMLPRSEVDVGLLEDATRRGE